MGGRKDVGVEGEHPDTGSQQGSGTQPKRVPIDSEPPADVRCEPAQSTPIEDAAGERTGGRAPLRHDVGWFASGRVPLDAWNEELVRRSGHPPEGDISLWRTESASIGRPERWVPAREGRAAPGDAFDLVRRSATTRTVVDLATEMAERFVLEDFTGALRAAEFLLGRDPSDPLARYYACASRDKLERLLYAQITQHGDVPVVEARDEEIRWLGLDARAMWLLSRMDGLKGCDALLAATGMERLEGLRVLSQLLEAGAIVMREPTSR